MTKMNFKDIKIGEVYTWEDKNGTSLVEATKFIGNTVYFSVLNSTDRTIGSSLAITYADKNSDINYLKKLK